MLRRDLIRVLTATPLAGWLRAWLPTTYVVTAGEGPNAAEVYRKAFGWAEGLSPEDSALLRKAASVEIDGREVGGLIRRARPALAMLREAAAIESCRWGAETPTRSDLGRGRLGMAGVSLVRASCLSARWQAKAGRGREALDDVFAGLTLAHRIGTEGVIIARVMECGGEVPAFQTLGRILPGLDRATLDGLSQRLDALPTPEPASATIGPESRFILGSIRTDLAATGPVIGDDQWDGLNLKEEAPALKRLTGGDRDRLLAHLDATGPAFAELARRLDLPRPGCRSSLDAFAEAERTTNPIVASLVEHAWGVRHVVDRMKALRAMLRAGLALVRDGEAAFLAVIDPFGTGPFGLERRGDGFRIRSALKDKEKPGVDLEIGGPA